MTTMTRRGAIALPLGLAAFTSACVSSPPDMMMGASDPSGRADPEMKALLDSYARLGPKPIEGLTPAEARRQPSMADAVKARAASMGNINPMRVIGSQQEMTLNTLPNALVARLYRPVVTYSGPVPLIVYFHGGGWVIADVNTYDAGARALCVEAGAMVLSINYRQGPEVRFPGAHDDANVAYAWAVRNAASINADPNKIAVAGESAGGNMALTTAIYARDAGLPAPKAVVSIYPVGGVDLNTPSYQQFANAKPLSKPAIQWFVQNYTRGPQDLQDPRLDIVGKANLANLPPVTLINAEIDPLQDDGARLEQKLRAAGNPVQRRLYPGVTHEFFGADAVLTKAKEAQSFAGMRLREAFEAPAAGAAPARGRRPATRRQTM